GDHVGALAVPLDSGEAHRGAGNETLRIGDELVEIVDRPRAALGFHRGREIEAAAIFAPAVADDAVEIRTDAVRPALLEGVAGLANLRGRLALLDGRRLQQLLDRLARRRSRFGLFSLAALFLGRDLESGLGDRLRREYRVGGEARDQQHETGGQHGTEDFIDFEGVHFRIRLQAGRSRWAASRGR